MITSPPSRLTSDDGTMWATVPPRNIGSPVPTIVIEAMIKFGHVEMLMDRMPNDSPTPRLSRFEVSAIIAAANQSIGFILCSETEISVTET